MSWLKLDDGFTRNPKVFGLSHQAFRLHLVALCHCATSLTDGVIQASALPILLAEAKVGRRYSGELVEAGLWIESDAGWTIHHFLEYNPTADKVKAARLQAAERQARFRARHNDTDHLDYAAIAERDEWTCYLCGKPVKERDASYDHVIPITAGGAHSDANVRLVHPKCNGMKGTRDVTRYVTLPQPSPSRTLKDSAEENGPLNRLLDACTDRDDRTAAVLIDLWLKHGLSEGDFEYARECAQGPGVRSPTAVAVRELQKRGEQKAKAS